MGQGRNRFRRQTESEKAIPLPQVLAGPIVRRVAGSSVSVWVALRDAAMVELKVWPGIQRSTGVDTVESGASFVAQGTAQTRKLGARLHVAVVTATAQGAPVAPGTIHSYDLKIGGDNLRSLGLLRDETEGNRLANVEAANAPMHLALGYELDPSVRS